MISQLDELLDLKRTTSDMEGHLKLQNVIYNRVMANITEIILTSKFPELQGEITDAVKLEVHEAILGRLQTRQFDRQAQGEYRLHLKLNNIGSTTSPPVE